MEIVENLAQWQTDFRNGWLAHYEETGQNNADLYVRPRNTQAPAGKGIDLAESRLLLITSSGAYLKHVQEPFDAEHQVGDYSLRTFPFATPPGALAFAHTHYNHAAVDADSEVLVPLGHLARMVDESRIGEMAPTVISFGGYLRDVGRVVDEVIPPMLEIAQKEKVDGALLVPA
jgi:hypothetical protein